MYRLDQFCNIIFKLRKEKGWTQTTLADKLGIAPQSISKWECGIGYPDVTLFPVIANLFSVPIGVLFGENCEVNDMKTYESQFECKPLTRIEVMLGNECQLRVIHKESDKAQLYATGDETFINYLSIEEENGTLRLFVKNPSGSDSHFTPYDRGGYDKENQITLYTGVKEGKCNCYVINYLDLEIFDCLTSDDSYKWICKRPK